MSKALQIPTALGPALVALALLSMPFIFALHERLLNSEFEAWALVVWLLIVPFASVLLGFSIDRRAEFAERALEGGHLDASSFRLIAKDILAARNHSVVLSATSCGIPAGLFMALIFPETELLQLNTGLGQSGLAITTKNAGFAVMALTLFGLWLFGIGGGVSSAIRSIVRGK